MKKEEEQPKKWKKREAKQDKSSLSVDKHLNNDKKPEIHENTLSDQSSSLTFSDAGSQTTIESPFHVSNEQSSASNFSVKSSKSVSWEQLHATDPLLVKWEEYKLLQKRIQKIRRHKFWRFFLLK